MWHVGLLRRLTTLQAVRKGKSILRFVAGSLCTAQRCPSSQSAPESLVNSAVPSPPVLDGRLTVLCVTPRLTRATAFRESESSEVDKVSLQPSSASVPPPALERALGQKKRHAVFEGYRRQSELTLGHSAGRRAYNPPRFFRVGHFYISPA